MIEYKNVLTTCPYCGTGCGFHLQVLNNELVGVLPAKDHPVSQGGLCIKGWNAHAFVYHKDRLTTPLIRKDGELVEASWDEALQLIADRLGEIKAQSGPDSIGFFTSSRCTNEENYLMQKLARAVIGTNNVDNCARLCHAPTVAGLAASFGSGAMSNSIPEFDTDTNCFFIIGSNTSEAHPLVSMHVAKGRNRGAKVIVLDPRKTQIGHWADIYYPLRPGTDVALINGLMNIIISEGLHDEAFIQERTEDFDALKALVATYTPERVAEICDIPVEGLYAIARTYATIKPAAILYTLGITEHTTGLDNVKSTANLAMLCGNMGIPGGGVNPLRGQNNVQGACDMGGLPNVYPGYQAVTLPEVQKKFQDAWGSAGPLTIGMTSTEMLPAAIEGRIRALFIFGENPMMADPNINHVRHCLECTEFLVVQDMFLCETAELADVVLPGASFAETDGTYTNTERRVQRVRKAIEPIGGSKENWRITCELARTMGAKGFDFASAQAVMEEVCQLIPSFGGINYDRLETEGWLQWPCPTVDHPGTPYLHKDKFARGLGKFFALEFREAAELPDDEYPLVLTTGRIMFHYHAGSMTRRSAKLESEAPEAYIEIHTDDAKEIGLNGHKRVRVSSRRGQIELRARVTDNIRRGVVYIPFHWAEAAANVLTNNAFDPVTKTPEYKVCAVKVEVA